MGIPEGLIRYSTGIEHPDDLIADLEQALAAEAERSCQGFKNTTIEAYDGPEVHRQIVSMIRKSVTDPNRSKTQSVAFFPA